MPSVQEKGVVVCYYDMSTPETTVALPAFEHLLKVADFVSKVPVRRSGIHFCLKNNHGSLVLSSMLIEKFVRSLQRNANTRSRLHYGSDMELQYILKTYGFSLDTFPVDTIGNLRSDILNVWFHKYIPADQRKGMGIDPAAASRMASSVGIPNSHQAEAMHEGNQQTVASTLGNCSNVQAVAHTPAHRNTTSISHTNNLATAAAAATKSIEPTANDVLLGKGRAIQMHPGNIRFREFLKEYQEEYNKSQRYKRVNTSTELTKVLIRKGTRFLQKTEDGGWVESDFSAAEKKVKQLFRSQKKLKTQE